MNISQFQLTNLKVTILCPMFFYGDAVGHSAYDYYQAFKELGFVNVRGVGERNDFPEMLFEHCENAQALLQNEWFQESDIVIYHFAIFHEFFEVLKKRNKESKHVICFHNVTPKEFTPKFVWEIIDKSFKQIQLFNYADAIWVDSRENKEELLRQGINKIPITEIPIAVDRPEITALFEKPKKQVELLTVGRFFPSKGLLDIVDAIALVKKKIDTKFILRLVGNTDYSDHSYIHQVKERINLHGLGEYIDFVGKVDESSLRRVFQNAHILVSASYHEGFCVPVIEALRAGMIPVTYNSGNLKWIANGNGLISEVGDIDLLAGNLISAINGVYASFRDENEAYLPLDNGLKSARQFSYDASEYSKQFCFEFFKERIFSASEKLYV